MHSLRVLGPPRPVMRLIYRPISRKCRLRLRSLRRLDPVFSVHRGHGCQIVLLCEPPICLNLGLPVVGNVLGRVPTSLPLRILHCLPLINMTITVDGWNSFGRHVHCILRTFALGTGVELVIVPLTVVHHHFSYHPFGRWVTDTLRSPSSGELGVGRQKWKRWSWE